MCQKMWRREGRGRDGVETRGVNSNPHSRNKMWGAAPRLNWWVWKVRFETLKCCTLQHRKNQQNHMFLRVLKHWKNSKSKSFKLPSPLTPLSLKPLLFLALVRYYTSRSNIKKKSKTLSSDSLCKTVAQNTFTKQKDTIIAHNIF